MLNHRGHVFACLCQATMPRDHDLTWGQRKCFMQTSQACRTARFYRDYFQSLHFVILCFIQIWRARHFFRIFTLSSISVTRVLHQSLRITAIVSMELRTMHYRAILCHTILCTVVPCNTINTIPWTTIIHAISPHLPCITQFAKGFRSRVESVIFAYFHLEYHLCSLPRCAWLCPDTVTSHGDKGSKRATQVFGSLAWRFFLTFTFIYNLIFSLMGDPVIQTKLLILKHCRIRYWRKHMISHFDWNMTVYNINFPQNSDNYP